jgi:predicted RNA-binding protein associated with RNAse of E/G family
VFQQWLVYESAQVRITLLEHAPRSEPLRARDQTLLDPGAPVVWFTFPGLWHDIGRFHLGDGTFTGFYCDVLRPVEFSDRLTWYATDLFLDLWLGSGDAFEVLDAEELDEAVARGALSQADQRMAWAEVERLRVAWQAGSWPPPSVYEWTLERVRTCLL